MPDYALMNQCRYEGKAKEVEQMTRDALAEGRHFQEVLNEGLIAGMAVVGEDFKHNILYVPEVLIAARAMKAGMGVLKPLLSAKDNATPRVGTLLMGTVRGDLHDIGKNLVCMMAEGAGSEVVDSGREQIKFAVGGAPISQMFADEIGADGYGQNASAAVDLFLRLAKGEAAPAAAPAPASKPAEVAEARPGTSSTYKILYWQEIPSQ